MADFNRSFHGGLVICKVYIILFVEIIGDIVKNNKFFKNVFKNADSVRGMHNGLQINILFKNI